MKRRVVATGRRAFSADARWKGVAEVPGSLTAPATLVPHTPGFSIKGNFMEGRPMYLDMQSTTPTDPRVLDAMMPWMTQDYGNPHSSTHEYGWDSENAVEKAREEVASLIGASPKEIVFTSGATESNNIAVKGVSRFYKKKKNHIVTTQTEHKCVLDSCRRMELEGMEVTYLPVEENGLVDLATLEAALRPETSMVSVMAVNNEIGVLQPLKEIGEMCRKRKIFFHTDAAQMLGKLPIDVNELDIDLMSLSGHKIYGPKGIGALYVRRKPRVRLEAQMSGGGQERGLRSGTLSPALCVGFGSACAVAEAEMERDHAWVSYLSEHMHSSINAQLPEVTLNGHPTQRYAGNLNLSFGYVEGESLLMAIKNVAVSSGRYDRLAFFFCGTLYD